jgi:hypothetical protein
MPNMVERLSALVASGAKTNQTVFVNAFWTTSARAAFGPGLTWSKTKYADLPGNGGFGLMLLSGLFF